MVQFPVGVRIVLLEAFSSTFIRSLKPAMRFEIFVVHVLKTFLVLDGVVMEIFSRNIRSKHVRIILADRKNLQSEQLGPLIPEVLLQCQGLLYWPLRKKKRCRYLN